MKKPQRFWAAQLPNGQLCHAWASVASRTGCLDKNNWLTVLLTSRRGAQRLASVYRDEGAEVVQVELRVAPLQPRKPRGRKKHGK
jgi:hypothetical protein